MRHFITLATLLAGIFFLQHPAVAQSYKVGDYYNDGTLEGVVFEVDASGKSGKIVGLTQPTEMFRPWCDDEGDQKRFINATDKYDGRKNHEVVEAIADWQTKYPMFAWCRQLGAGWYLPAIEELKAFTLNRSTHAAVNRTLKAKGATPLADHSDSSSWYWSSTESAEYEKAVDEYSAHHVWMNQNYATTSYKSYPYFGVRAIARFGTASQSGSLKPVAAATKAQPTTAQASTTTTTTAEVAPKGDATSFEFTWPSITAAAEAGNLQAMCHVADHYCWGEGVCDDYQGGKNYKKALEWYRKAADRNHTESIRKMGDMYNFGKGVKASDREARKWYEKASNNGDTEAMISLGDSYKYALNKDAAEDRQKALEWYLEAARGGNKDANFSIGLTLFYLDGDGNKEESYVWLARAAQNGSSTASELLTENGIKSYEFKEYAAKKTRIEGGRYTSTSTASTTPSRTATTTATTSKPNPSSYTPQYCFNRGKQLRDQHNYEEAIPWLERAAEARYRPAYRHLADCYNTSGHSKTDPRKAWSNYASCVGGDGCDPNSHDYWYACFMLGNMFKVGRGCEKNYDSALYFLREFRKYTQPINYDTADKAINEVLALQRQEAAAAPSRSTTTASTNTTPRQSSGSSGSKADMVARPAYGQLPNVVYMQNLDNEYLVMKMSFFQQDGKIMMRCNKGATLCLYILDSNEDNLWSFQEAKIGPGPAYTWNTVSYYPDRLGHMIVIMKDWSRVGYQGFFVCERHITEAEYNRCEDIFQRGVKNMAAYAASMNGGGGGGSVGTAQVQSGMSESYYRNMYDQYARLAESTYNTLTTTGYSISVNDKESEGGTMGGWSSSDYSTLKRDLRNAQSNMSRIRSEAARAGYTISASHWESVSVSY